MPEIVKRELFKEKFPTLYLRLGRCPGKYDFTVALWNTLWSKHVYEDLAPSELVANYRSYELYFMTAEISQVLDKSHIQCRFDDELTELRDIAWGATCVCGMCFRVTDEAFTRPITENLFLTNGNTPMHAVLLYDDLKNCKENMYGNPDKRPRINES